MENAGGADQCFEELVRMLEILSEKLEYLIERSSLDFIVRSSDFDYFGYSVRVVLFDFGDFGNMAVVSIFYVVDFFIVIGQRSIDLLNDDCFQLITLIDIQVKQKVDCICDSSLVLSLSLGAINYEFFEDFFCGGVVFGVEGVILVF